MPGTAEHAAIYLGQGKVMNVNPNVEPSIREQPLHEFIQGFDEQNIHFLRFSNQDTTNKRVIDFIYWHQHLEMEGKTGIEMEALSGASIAALTVYDMCKAISQKMIIKEVKLLEKTGGKSDINRS